jgi:alkylhydroperoxidase family enzyme
LDIQDAAAPEFGSFGQALAATPMGAGAGAFVGAVAKESTLPGRVAEAARIRIAQINGCMLCMDARLGSSEDALGEDFYDNIVEWREWPGYQPAERLAAEFAERFALAHHSIDDDLWVRLRSEFSDKQIIDLGLSVAEWLGIGRFTRVLGLDRACSPASLST